MLLADRQKLWPRLEGLGEEVVRKKYLASKFESFEEPEVAEWLQRCRTINAAQESKKAAKIAIWTLTAALIAAAGGIVSALTNLWSLFPK